MKTIALTILLLALPFGRGQVIVHDPIVADIAVTHNAEELIKLVRMIEEMQATKDWIGNGKKILELAGIDAVFTNLRTESIGISRVELATTATSATGATYDGDGLYAPVGETFQSRDGQTITRPDSSTSFAMRKLTGPGVWSSLAVVSSVMRSAATSSR